MPDQMSRAQEVAQRVAVELEGELDDAIRAAAARGYRAGVKHALDELERLGLTDEIAGGGSLDSAVRRLRTESR